MRFEKIRTFIKSLDMRSKASSKEINAKNFYGKDDSDIPGYTSDHIIFCDCFVKIYKSKDT